MSLISSFIVDLAVSESEKENVVLHAIDMLLRQNGKCLQDYPGMPVPTGVSAIDMSNMLILEELSYDKEALREKAVNMVKFLNDEQHLIYDHVMDLDAKCVGGFFFVYGYGGTGKTFFWNMHLFHRYVVQSRMFFLLLLVGLQQHYCLLEDLHIHGLPSLFRLRRHLYAQ